MPTSSKPGPARVTQDAGQQPNHRTSLKEKLRILGNGAKLRATKARVREFQRLFAFRYSNATVTRVRQGPRSWTKLPERLNRKHVIRHLLANSIPSLQPIWFGARSLLQSTWFCIDVDADRTKEEVWIEEYALARDEEENRRRAARKLPPKRRNQLNPKAPYSERCALVERAFRRLGIDPTDPRQVLIQPTPSGGRHYFVFLDLRYNLCQLHDLLISAGLTHTPGEVEFFPRTNQALRLPFGHIPGQPHDPNRWIQFIDDYRNHRVRRFSLAELQSNLDKHRDRWTRQVRSVRAQRLYTPVHATATRPILGIPKAHHTTRNRFDELLTKGIHSTEEANELLELGIQEEGHRTEVLMHLAAHLIWFRHQSADEAAEFLTAWALTPRHASKDITADLAKGTTVVANHIATMCRWHEAKKQTTPNNPANANNEPEYSPVELRTLRSCLEALPPDDRIKQAHFLLHFLRFAKRHGSQVTDGTGWEAAPAVRPVIRRWTECDHMKYKDRISHAISHGCMEVVKEAWHRPNGPGRARTYRLSVPVVPESQCVMNYEAALNYLTASDSPAPTQ